VAEHGVRSGAGVVIRTQYESFGVILVYANNERTFTDYELAFLRATANIAGEAISRAKTEQALRKSEARLRQLIASTLDAVVTIDRTKGRMCRRTHPPRTCLHALFSERNATI
jgi:GAF domain-containing protein